MGGVRWGSIQDEVCSCHYHFHSNGTYLHMTTRGPLPLLL